ncbi:hypothetical protein [Blastopirellula retiformator]|uniref:hypothetical protein n=1 Tax=Blastopirellula retiformator TaxID=2527970 RepID=UPI0011B7C5A2|nr:hypothetical protein [Blastopirellula retiformator]
MAESCTIYCKLWNLKEFARLLDSYFPSTIPTSDDLTIVHDSDGNLRLTQKKFREPGDDFCRLLLSTCAFVEGLPNADAVVKKWLASHVESCELVLGVVAEPAFDADERFHAVVFAIAKAFDGVIFNGHEMLDANGVTLLATS